MKTKEQILSENDKPNGRSVVTCYDIVHRDNALQAMEQYSEQNCDAIYELFSKPANILKPLENSYRKENPLPNNEFYLPDNSKFYKWIVKKVKSKKTITDYTWLNNKLNSILTEFGRGIITKKVAKDKLFDVIFEDLVKEIQELKDQIKGTAK